MPGGLNVDYVELGVRDGTSPVESCDLDTGPRVSRRYGVAWEDRIEARWQLLGYSYLDADGKLLRYTPQRDPDEPTLFASRITRIAGIASTGKEDSEYGKSNTYKQASIEVEFTARPYDVLDDEEISSTPGAEYARYVEYSNGMDAEYLASKTVGRMKWADGPDGPPNPRAFPGNIGKILPKAQIRRTWHQIPYAGIPWAAIYGTIGKVNKKPFEDAADDVTYDPGQLLLVGADIRTIRMARAAAWGWTVGYQWSYRENTWNKFYDFNPDGPGYYQVSIDGVVYDQDSDLAQTGKLVYDSADFAALFTVP